MKENLDFIIKQEYRLVFCINVCSNVIIFNLIYTNHIMFPLFLNNFLNIEIVQL